MSDAQAPAGWFPDPEDAAQLRYWDGAAWTDHRHPAAPPAPPAGPAPAQFAYQPTSGVQPGSAAPYGAAPAYGAPQNVLALVGLILAIVGTVLGFFIGFFALLAIAGGVLSIVGLTQANRMRAAGTPGDRRGLALAGIIVGFGGLLLIIVVAAATAVYYASMYSYF